MINIQSNLNKKIKNTQIYTLSQFLRQNLIKMLAIILFAIFLTKGNEKIKNTQIYTLSQFLQQNLIKMLAIILFAIFLTKGNEFSNSFFFYRHKEAIKICHKF